MTKDLLREFIQNCRDNKLDGVTDCLSRGVDVNTVSEDGRWSGLTIAAEKNYPELLEILLSHPDIKINNKTSGHWTALMFAFKHGNPTIVSRLVQVPGLDINYQDVNGWTAAHWASWRGQTECVRILAENDRVDWNKRDKWGQTPLYLALWRGHSDIVDVIMQQPNVDYNVKTEDGETLAIPGVCRGNGGETLGHVAVWGGDVKCVETLAAQETFDCWNVPDKKGNTPIMMALYMNKTNIVEILLRCPRVDLSSMDEEGWYLLFFLVSALL